MVYPSEILVVLWCRVLKTLVFFQTKLTTHILPFDSACWFCFQFWTLNLHAEIAEPFHLGVADIIVTVALEKIGRRLV